MHGVHCAAARGAHGRIRPLFRQFPRSFPFRPRLITSTRPTARTVSPRCFFPFQAVLPLLRFALRRQDTFFRLPHCIEADAEGSAVAAVCRASLPARTPPSAQAAGGGCMPRAGVPHSTNRFHEMTRAEGVSLRDWESEVG